LAMAIYAITVRYVSYVVDFGVYFPFYMN
jgi:hypothetical protein